MIIKLTNSELDMLREVARKHDFEERITWNLHQGNRGITLSEDDADEFREFCSDYLLSVGFDKAYRTNQAGEILEGLIDKLFVEE
ncbi:hypothetical protein [Coraliomargarita akajimensis]|uniref:Uncharacterized protein n=1 Tax=Coraliomargarita akajimensis (strain DSM 45221 / IAM 15411 / JCM 23193 / KCTC 12865 / 04OKA010-24) TaxID=583355 RepID=D5EQD1_CORAD|nr:hypothetical protein [Coraliomargarita akajimensis]ADE53899.1 hypothetical protein Caka_0876 [Coraliomargarita akajimensis DSM 45221]